MTIKPGICLNCQKPITKGRADKKFCDTGCKDEYYNKMKSEEQGEIGKINSILKRNRRVLKKLFDPKKEERTIKREEMIREGFEFGFHTHFVVTKVKGNEIVFCYDYGYREVKVDEFQIYESFGKVKVKDGYSVKIR